jgi:hypothetical protein
MRHKITKFSDIRVCMGTPDTLRKYIYGRNVDTYLKES